MIYVCVLYSMLSINLLLHLYISIFYFLTLLFDQVFFSRLMLLKGYQKVSNCSRKCVLSRFLFFFISVYVYIFCATLKKNIGLGCNLKSCIVKSGIVIPPALLFFIRIALLLIMFFIVSFRIYFIFLWGKYFIGTLIVVA